MIELAFVRGSQLRKIRVDGTKIKFMSSETGFEPVEIDLSKMDKVAKEEIKKLDPQFLKEMKALHNEKDRAKDIIKDFRRTGWRVFKQDGMAD